METLLEQHGFLVIEKVLEPREVTATVEGMWSWLLRLCPSLRRDDLQTWKANLPYTMGAKGLMQWYRVGHQQFVWDIRQNPEVYRVFQTLWKENDLLVSYDGICFQAPPELTGKYSEKYSEPWWHMDQGKKKRGFHCVQAFVNLEETTEEDGCFICLPGSHKFHQEFMDIFGAEYGNNDWVKLEEKHRAWYLAKGLRPVRVPCPKGGMVLWDSRTVHCNASALRGRKTLRPRIVIYVCMTPRRLIKTADLKKKQKYFHEGRMTSHWPHIIHVFPKIPYPLPEKAKYEEFFRRADEIAVLPQLTELGKRLAGF